MLYIVTITAQLSAKSYATPFEPMRFECSSPAVAANKGIRAAKRALPRKKITHWNIRIVPVAGTTK